MVIELPEFDNHVRNEASARERGFEASIVCADEMLNMLSGVYEAIQDNPRYTDYNRRFR